MLYSHSNNRLSIAVVTEESVRRPQTTEINEELRDEMRLYLRQHFTRDDCERIIVKFDEVPLNVHSSFHISPNDLQNLSEMMAVMSLDDIERLAQQLLTVQK